MHFWYILKIALRNISRNKRRTSLSIFAIGMAVFVVCFMQSYVTGIFQNYKKNIFTFESGHIKIIHKDFIKEEKLMPLDLAIYDYETLIKLLHNIKEITYILPRIKFPAVINIDTKMKNILGFALNPELEKDINPLERKIIKGRIFKKFNSENLEIIMGKSLADELKIGVGDKITIMSKTSEEGLAHVTFKIVGLVSYGVAEFDKTFFFTDLTTAQKILRLENAASEIVVFLKNENQDVKIAEKINKIFKENGFKQYIAYPWKKQKDGQYNYMFVKLKFIYNIVYAIFLFLASLVIINNTMMAIYERINEIGTISALGMKKEEIVLLFFLESVIISVIGSFWGSITGGLASYIFSIKGINFAKLSGGGVTMQVSNIVYTYFGFDLLLFSFAFGIIITAACVLLPSFKAAKIEPVEALRRVY